MKFDSQIAIQTILLVVCSCQFGFVNLVALACKDRQYQNPAGMCCDKCGPGTFVLSHCNETSQTVCEDCKRQDGYSDDWSSKTQCTPCGSSLCQPTMGLVQKCNSTVGNKCGCRAPNTYHNTYTDSCSSCKPCPAGQYPVKPCSAETICADCPPNHFSSMDKNYKKTTCSPCTKCDSYISVCTPKKDAVCAVVTSPFSTTPFPTEWTTIFHVDTIEPSTKPADKKNSSRSNRNETTVNPKVIAVIIVVAVLVILFIAAVAYLRKRKPSRCSRKREFLVIQESRRKSVSFGGLLLREQPGTIMENLHTYLNPELPNNWKGLAAELGIKYIEIRNFEANPSTAAKDMLNSWSTSNEATIDRLYKALQNIRRDDVCSFLEENVEFDSEETIV